MKCTTIHLPGGGVAIACGRGRAPEPCTSCGLASSKLCDAPVEVGGKLVDGKRLCSAPICGPCAQTKGNEDFCRLHAKSDDPKAEVGSFERKPSATAGNGDHSPDCAQRIVYGDGVCDCGAAGASERKVPRARCRSCSATIVWAYTAGGKAMPVDVVASPKGNLRVYLSEGEPQVRVIARDEVHEGPRFTSHLATCADAATHRRKP